MSGLTLHELVRGWERNHPGLMLFDLASTKVKPQGVIIRTAADFAAIEKADREAKMEEEQRKIFQAVLLELKQKTADRGLRETVDAIGARLRFSMDIECGICFFTSHSRVFFRCQLH